MTCDEHGKDYASHVPLASALGLRAAWHKLKQKYA